MAERHWQEEQAELDMQAQEDLEYFYEHPEEWPTCGTCGKKRQPTGTTQDGRVEFHCGQGGHAVTIKGR
jgi:hypothetical protein